MTDSDAIKTIQLDICNGCECIENCITNQCEYFLAINALEKKEKIKEIIAKANQWSKEDIVVKEQAYCDIEKILRSEEE